MKPCRGAQPEKRSNDAVPQLDIPSKGNGTAKYGIDVMLPGMVYGNMITPPVRFCAMVKDGDTAAAFGTAAKVMPARRPSPPVRRRRSAFRHWR
jgi:hypothetical protein